ncbi:MAG: 1,4-dihydroxy-2-naphthoate polyprenyltransferase [Acidimicrobiaceae bacterium]|nr:1,4-dihydroxy-2-naphthoate polyprenyltransferase [Acidimicrobiaceae bacterium]|tara:strand:+ start:121 stop:984 length:864 start_codon:yes stop_codon:yes gene_type:complete
MRRWILGARLRTLPSAVVPVIVGTSVAAGGEIIWWRAAAALVVAVALQVATNYANDLSDGVRGTDGPQRVGPVRLVGSGLASPAEVRVAMLAAFAVAAVAGLTLAAAVTPWLLLVGGASIAAGWLYTGGPRPYGYLGLGELFVFTFFGLVATVGSTYIHQQEVPAVAWPAAVAVGFLACALLVVNNLRDRPADAESGKRTLAVRLGDRPTRILYVVLVDGALVVGSLCALSRPWAVLVLGAGVVAGPAVRRVMGGGEGLDLIDVLGRTGRTQLAAGVLLAAGLALSA